jgi:DNA-binding IclR family transcriptional regulator
MKKKRGTGPTQARTLALIDAGTDRFMDIVKALGKPKGPVGAHLNRLLSYGIIERIDRGRYRVVR